MKKKEFLEKAILAIDVAEREGRLVVALSSDFQYVFVRLNVNGFSVVLGISKIIKGAIEAKKVAKRNLAQELWKYKKFLEDNEATLGKIPKSDLEYIHSLIG